MSPQRGLLAIDLRGTLDQRRLEILRTALGMTRRGRLTDTQDEEFGVRYLRDGQPSPSLTLWRSADDRWRVSLMYYAHDQVGPEELTRVVAQVADAAAQVGLTVEGQRRVEPPDEELPR